MSARNPPLRYNASKSGLEIDGRNLGDAAPHGPVTTTLHDNGDNAQWASYFGLPKREIAKDPYMQYGRENYDLPEAYKGSNLYLDLLVIYQIKLSDMYAITQLLPMKMVEDTMSVSWDVWSFDQGRLGRTPEESMSRMLTSKFDTGKATFHRWGLAFMLEHGFWKTPRGRMNYRYNLVQIANATIETLCYGAMIALLSCSPMSFLPSQQLSQIDNDAQRWAIFQEEVDQWAFIHKHENPLMKLWDKLSAKVARVSNGTRANKFVIPFGARAAARPENYFFLSGKVNDYKAGTQMPGVPTYETRDYKLGEGAQDDDPNFQERTAGQGLYMLFSHLRGVPEDKYRTSMMDIAAIQERDDAFKPISYAQAVLDSGVFEENKETGRWDLTEVGRVLFADEDMWGGYMRTVGMLDRWTKQLLCKKDRLMDFLRKFGRPAEVNAPDAGVHVGAYAGPGDAFVSAEGVRLLAHLQGAVRDAGAAPAAAAGVAAVAAPGGGQSLAQVAALVRALRDELKPIIDSKASNTDKIRIEGEVNAINRLLAANGIAAAPLLANRYATAADLVQLRVDLIALVNGLPAPAPAPAGNTRVKEIKAAILAVDAGAAQLPKAVNRYAYALAAFNAANPKVKAELKTFAPARDDAAAENRYKAFARALAPASASASQNVPIVHFERWGHTATTTDEPDFIMADGTVTAASNGHFKTEMAKPGMKALWSLFAQDFNQTVVLTAPLRQSTAQIVVDNVADSSASGWFLGQIGFAALVSAVNEKKGGGLSRQNVLDLVDQSIAGTLAINYLASDAAMDDIDKTTVWLGLDGGFSADMAHQSAEQKKSKMPAADQQPQIDMRRVGEFEGVYSSVPVLTTLLGKENIFILYHNMVLGQNHNGGKAGGKDPDRDHRTISPQQFQYLVALVEDIYSEEMDKARSGSKTAKESAAAERKAYMHATCFLQECAFQRIFSLETVINSTAAFNGNLSISGFITSAKQTQLRASIEATSANIATVAAGLSDIFLTEWHNKLPSRVRYELDTRGASDIVAHGSSVAELRDAVARVKARKEESGDLPAGAGGLQADGVTDTHLADLLLHLRINDGELVHWGLDNDMFPLIGILLPKPNATWTMGTCFAMVGDGGSGYTFQGHHDFQLQDDAIHKMHVGHWTLYAKPVVIQPMIAHGFNVQAQSYVGGNENDMWQIQNPEHRAAYVEGDYFFASGFPVACYINRPDPFWVYDITNSFNRHLGGTPAICKERMLEVYSKAWGWKRDTGNPLVRPIIPHEEEVGRNTLVFQATQLIYNSKTDQRDIRIRGRGHWGDREYDGCCKVRRGNESYLLPVGAPGTSITAIVT